jgi:hypothetical protein
MAARAEARPNPLIERHGSAEAAPILLSRASLKFLIMDEHGGEVQTRGVIRAAMRMSAI